MAQDGDTITYTATGDGSVSEDVSSVDTAVVDYCDGSGGDGSERNTGGAGGRVENAEIDVSTIDTLYFWVGAIFPSDVHNGTAGRYGGALGIRSGGGSTEIAQINTAQGDGNDEPFLVAAGGGSSGGGSTGGSGAARGGGAAFGTSPPAGGDAVEMDQSGEDGGGAIDDQNRGIVSGGTTITGGGSEWGFGSEGEIQVTYKVTLSPPDPPSNLSAEVQ